MVRNCKHIAWMAVLSALLLFIAVPLGAQERKGIIRGRVFENFLTRDSSKYEVPLQKVRIVVTQGGDSTVTRTDGMGVFYLSKLAIGEAHLKFSSKGYYDQHIVLDVQEDESLLYVEMFRKPESLSGARVVAVVPPMTHRKDTIIYNAAAVSLNEGENAIEILRQMPGVEIRDGKIYVGGQQVKRTYVNGRLIYGDNASKPLTAIVAEDVTNIKTYEELSVEDRLKGNKNGKKDRVLDVTTKDPVFSAFDGHILASGGADASRSSEGRIQPRYQGAFSGSLFSEQLLASLKFNANNIGRSDNALQSLNQPYGALHSNNDKLLAELSFSKFWGDRLLGSSVNAGYSFTRNHSRTFSNSLQDYFATGSSPARQYADTSRAVTKDGTHNIYAALNLNTSKAGRFLISTTLGIRRSLSDSYSGTRSVQGEDIARTAQRSDGSMRGIAWDGSFYWSKNHTESGWAPYVRVAANVGGSSEGRAVVDTLASSFHRRKLSIEGGGRNWSVTADAGVSKQLVNNDSVTFVIMPGLAAEVSSSRSKSLSMDLIDPDNPVTDAVNTYDYSNDLAGINLGLPIEYTSKAGSLFLSLSPGFRRSANLERLPGEDGFAKLFFTPDAQISFHNREIYAGYHLNTRIPALEQLRERIDDRNPMFIQAGNSALKASHTHTVSVSWHHSIDNKYLPSNVNVKLNSSLADNPVVSNSIYYSTPTHITGWGGYDIQPGTTFTTYENASGPSFNMQLSMSYVIRLQKIKSNVHLDAGLDWASSPMYVSGTMMRSRDLVPDAGVSYNYRGKVFNARLSYGVSYLRGTNNAGQVITTALKNSYSASLGLNIAKKFFVNTETSGTLNHYLSGGLKDVNIFTVNACAGVRLLKGRLIISASASDLLSRSNSYSVNNSADHRLQTWTPSFGRYYMLNVAFRLNKTSAKSSPLDMFGRSDYFNSAGR